MRRLAISATIVSSLVAVLIHVLRTQRDVRPSLVDLRNQQLRRSMQRRIDSAARDGRIGVQSAAPTQLQATQGTADAVTVRTTTPDWTDKMEKMAVEKRDNDQRIARYEAQLAENAKRISDLESQVTALKQAAPTPDNSRVLERSDMLRRVPPDGLAYLTVANSACAPRRTA
jgi:hypothetical protein